MKTDFKYLFRELNSDMQVVNSLITPDLHDIIEFTGIDMPDLDLKVIDTYALMGEYRFTFNHSVFSVRIIKGDDTLTVWGFSKKDKKEEK